jgi:hypothetical protein
MRCLLPGMTLQNSRPIKGRLSRNVTWPCGQQGKIRACGVWTPSPIPQGNDRSPMDALFHDRADCFGPSSLAPRDAIYQGWPAGQSEDRPL